MSGPQNVIPIEKGRRLHGCAPLVNFDIASIALFTSLLLFFRGLWTFIEIRVRRLPSVQGEAMNTPTLDMDLKGSQTDFRWSRCALTSFFFHHVRLNCDFCRNDVSQFHDLCPPGQPWLGFPQSSTPQSPTTCAPDLLHNHKTNSIKEG